MTTRDWVQNRAGSTTFPSETTVRTLAIPFVAFALLLGVAPAHAQDAARARVEVVEVTGRIDPVLADFVASSLRKAASGGASVLVLRLNSPGSVLDDDDQAALVRRVRDSSVPVAAWVGPSGSEARGAAVDLLRAADVRGVAPNAEVDELGAAAARARGVVELTSPTLGAFVNDLHGRQVAGGAIELPTKVVQVDGRPQRQPLYEVSFSKPSLLPRLLHTAASPAVAWLLLVIGLLLVVFEFFTAGVGVAGVTGAGALVLAAYGLDVLPTRPLGLALVLVAVFGFSVDVQTGVPRAWSAIGAVALALGGANLFRGASVGVLPYVLGVVGAPLFAVAGMAGVVRSRFSTPTIGRESMVGEEGLAIGAINPDGTVRVRGALWRARTNRATPIPGGEAVRVASIDGLLLEVEPLEGAARDARH